MSLTDFNARISNAFSRQHHSVSNLGMYDVKEFTAIINPPHAGILAVGAPQLVLDEAGQRRTHVTVTLSVDAAQVESPEAAAWLDAFAAALREPMLHC